MNPYLAFFLAIYGIVCRVTITASSEKYVDISDMICVETAAVIVTYIVDKEEALTIPTESSIKSLFETYGSVTNVKLINFPSEKINFQSGSAAVHFSLTTDGIRSALKSVEDFQQKTVDGVTYFCRLHDSLQEMIYSIHTNNFAQQETKPKGKDEHSKDERPKADFHPQDYPIARAFGGALVGNGVLYTTFAVLGLTPIGPIADGLFAINMGAGLAAGSVMSILQSAAMTPLISYARATATGTLIGLLPEIKEAFDCIAKKFTSKIPEVQEHFQEIRAAVTTGIPFQQHYENAKEAVTVGVAAGIPVVQQRYENAKEAVTAGVAAGIPVVQQHYENAKEAVTAGVAAGIPVVQQRYENAKEAVKEYFTRKSFRRGGH